MNTFIVIPAFNEGRRIGQTIIEVKKYCPNIVVVDDGSLDNTWTQADSAGAVVLRHIINRGQGAALRTGISYALERGAECIITFDADGQFEAKEILEISQFIINGETDIVFGSRFLSSYSIFHQRGGGGGLEKVNGTNMSTNIPFFKKILLKSAIIFTKLLTGLKLTDTHNGFRALNRKAASQIKINQDRMAHASEIVHQTAKLGLRYKEIPITVKYTEYSKSKGQRLSGAFKILFDLIFR